MTLNQMYERVLLVLPVEQRQFLNRLNDTIIELGGLYGDVPKLLYNPIEDDVYPDGQWINSSDKLTYILPLYHEAIVDNILFLSGAGETYKAEFLRKAHNTWLKYWNVDAKNRNTKRRGCRKCLIAK